MNNREKLAQRRLARQRQADIDNVIYTLAKKADRSSASVWKMIYPLFLDSKISARVADRILSSHSIYNRNNCITITKNAVAMTKFFVSVNDKISNIFHMEASAEHNRLAQRIIEVL